jgi:hypothetical protein
MVRTSRRSVLIAKLRAKVRARAKLRLLSLLEDDDDDGDDSDDDFRDELLLINTYLDLRLKRRLKKAIRSRYLSRSVYRRYSDSQFGDDIRDDDDPFLNDTEFLQKYRMKHTSFDKLLAYIKDHFIFQRFVLVYMFALLLFAFPITILTPRQAGKRTTTSSCSISITCCIAFSRNRRGWE